MADIGGFWYILKYNTTTQNYEQNWVSEIYESYISRITISDINNDGVMEIFVGFENGKVLIFNSITKALIGQITIPTGNLINDIQIGDPDNDSVFEIAISDDDNIYFYNKTTFLLESQTPFGCYDFKIGNVDGDAQLEIVINTGKVIEFNGTNATVGWVFDSNVVNAFYYLVELSDIDSDGIKEIIRAKNWYYIDVYDANTQSLKYEIETDLDIHALLLKDINNDSIDEIIYGDAQWGSIFCINSSTQMEMWHIHNPEHGITGLSVADVNNDGSLEIMWGAGWTSSGADYFFVADIATQNIEWTSVAIDGPFYAIDIADIDNDGTKEIVTISYESASGYESGIISVFNSETDELEWQSDGVYLYGVWTGIFDLKLFDIDNDGIKEIIVAAGQIYTGKIWIIDGVTKLIDSSYLFNVENISSFYALEIKDIDNDGDVEIIVGNENKIYIINPSDFSIEWNSAALLGNYRPATILTGNTDTDSDTEIITCLGYIYTIDGISHQQWQSSESNYSSIDLFDFTNDGKNEIVAGTNNGYIKIFDGTTHQITSSLKVCNGQIDGIKVTDLNSDLEPEIVFTSNGIVYFFSDTNLFQYTQKYSEIAGKYNSLKILDIDNDGKKEIFIGTSNKVIEITSNCYNCLWFSIEPAIKDVSCGGVNDGSIDLKVSGGSTPYIYLWNNASSDSVLFNLSPNTYIVTVTDNIGCKIVDTLLIKQAELITNYSSNNVSCNQTNNGSAIINIIKGSPPYSYIWSTGDTTNSVSNLSNGTFTVTINDSRNCTSTKTILIESDTIILHVYKSDISCYGYNDGSISTYIYEGTPPYFYQWNNGATTSSIYNLAEGNYSLTVSDFSGCRSEQSIIINKPQEIISQIATTIDDPNTAFGEGTATINIAGGTPPYSIHWNDPFSQTGIKAINLPFGKYIATIIDANWCHKTDTAIIDTVQSVNELIDYSSIKVYPNPTNGKINLEVSVNRPYNIYIYIHDYIGRLVYIDEIISSNDLMESIDLSNFNNGIYCVSVIINKNRFKYYIEIVK